MVFLHNDFYTASGSVKLYNCWTEKVTKHDTSSFYNWEEDNLPLYDLDERTYYLWEKLGHPTSSIPGVVLVVSAGGLESDYTCNKNLFTSIENAIDSLPEVLNYPVIIEVCNKGQLGSLNIKNLKCSKYGSLEIVNKVFAKAEPLVGTSAINSVQTIGAPYELINYLYPLELPEFGVINHFSGTKSEFLNKNIFSSTQAGIDLSSIGDGNYNAFAMLAANGYYNRPTYCAAGGIGVGVYNPASPAQNFLGLDYFEAGVNNQSQEEINFNDVSAFEEVTFGLLAQADVSADLGDAFYFTKQVVGLFYGNQLTNIKISNCDGPVYIRNFFVDGSGYTYPSNNYGVEVNGSENIFLENCISVRNNKAGFYFNDSKVIITRGLCAYRNYARPRIDLSTVGYDRDLGAGLLANNSEIYFSSTKSFEQSLIPNDPVFSGLLAASSLSYGLNYPLNFNKNANGIILNNSKFYGGIAGASPTQLITDVNRFCGIRLNNSELSFDGRVVSLGNYVGLMAENSLIRTDYHSFIHNQDYGVKLLNSNFIYNKNLSGTGLQFLFDRNGSHLKLNNSNYYCDVIPDMPNLIGNHRFVDAHGVSNDVESPKPSISLLDSSKCLLVHPYIIRSASSVPEAITTPFNSKHGLGILVKDNSNTTLKGSKTAANVIVGPEEAPQQANSVGLLVTNDSSLNIEGPTFVGQFAINVLAENNSVLNIQPHLSDENTLEISEFNLSDSGNHTKVELHSTRACLVANKNSTLNIKDLGSFWENWENSTNGVSALNKLPDQGLQSHSYTTSGGYLQFYPNPFNLDEANELANYSLQTTSIAQTAFNLGGYYLKDFTGSPATNTFSSITLGGMCVRAFNNSIVNVQNVNFPCGWWNTDSPIFDTSLPVNLCSKLFIWNIADNSQLNAAYTSVSSVFPKDAGYHGPLALWTSSFTQGALMGGTPLSGLPNSTPDTSSFSIFDYFGSGPASGSFSSIFYTSSFENIGPFRLYFSVDPACNFLNLARGLVSATDEYYTSGWLYQIYSQGYQPPFSASAIPDASAIHKSLIKGNYKSGVLSGYYYGSSILHAPNTIRVFLDESAANTFANAKHCSVGKSGLGKVVSIHYPYRDPAGAESTLEKDYGTGIYSVNIFDVNRIT